VGFQRIENIFSVLVVLDQIRLQMNFLGKESQPREASLWKIAFLSA